MDLWVVEYGLWWPLSWSECSERFIVFFKQCVNYRSNLASKPTNHFALTSWLADKFKAA